MIYFASITDTIQSTAYVVSVVVIIISGIVVYKSNKNSKSSAEYQKLNDAYEKRIKFLEEAHTDNNAKIHHLEGQVDVLKDIPLRELAESHKAILETQNQIIGLLKVGNSQTK